MTNWKEYVFSPERSFTEKTERIFRYQWNSNAVYRRFCDALEISPETVNPQDQDYPMLPVDAFKDADVVSKEADSFDLVFRSSGTSAMVPSTHYVHDSELYEYSLMLGFATFYEVEPLVIWAYMPDYMDNAQSSLVWMVNHLIKQDTSDLSKFLPIDEPIDLEKVNAVAEDGYRLMIFGAAFGLLDLLELGHMQLPDNAIILETGGMKTHKREISRNQLHQKLSEGFGIPEEQIHSEYGMAELLSQAYAQRGGWFETVPWMSVQIRNPDNPLETVSNGEEGLIAVIDLANVYSCSFLLTGDRGVQRSDGAFRVLGRWNPENLRGCNFLIDQE